jgi:dihydroorotate dehydrogenase (NAD+) catalytic subunit
MTPSTTSPPPVNLSTTVGSLTLQSPLLNASGCFNPSVFHEFYPLERALGGIITKTTTMAPRPGNPLPRIVELPGIGMLNSIGLQNPGIHAVLEDDINTFYHCDQLPLILSIAACSIEEFVELVHTINAHPNSHRIRAFEVNLSCPNVAKGGVDFGKSPEHVEAILHALSQTTETPLFAKLTPNVSSMVPMAEAAVNGGATGIVAINTLLGSHINTTTRKATLPRVSGGYSGPGVFPAALHHVIQLRQALPRHIAIIGVGGIHTGDHILQMLMAGASAVQLGTQCFTQPSVFARCHQALSTFCQQEGVTSLDELIGCAIA